MKRLPCLFSVLIAIGVAAAFFTLWNPADPVKTGLSASTTSPYVLQRIPSSVVPHGQIGPPHIRLAESTSGNWSGYAVPAQNGSSFTDVQGSWTVPAVTGPKGSYKYSAIWVGIDGYSTPTVEQIGTEQDWVSKAGSYYAWFEMYPTFAYEISGFPVRPGDEIAARVTVKRIDSRGHKIFALTIHNVTQNASFTVPPAYTTSSAAQLQSAEWVVEAPSSTRGVLPLADFDTAHLYQCAAHGNSISSYTGLGLDPLTLAGMTNRRLYTKAVPSAVNDAIEGFTVAWVHQ
jgi:hypothetical protein